MEATVADPPPTLEQLNPHPWGDEEDVAFDWQRIGDSALCAVALARR